MDIAAGLSAVSSAIGVAKTLRDVDRQLDIAELKAKLAEILINLSDAKIALLESREALSEKDIEIDRLREAREERLQLREGDGGFLYRTTEDGSLVGFPVCPKCVSIKGKHTLLVQDGKDVRSAKCPVCDTGFSPVTCYTKGDRTLYSEAVEQRRLESERQNARLASYNRRSSPWVV